MQVVPIYSRAQVGIEAPLVRVEVYLSGGLPATHIVGLPAAAVREARERVRAALLSGQFTFPTRRITINLAPADFPKNGGRFDLPIALGILAASGQIPATELASFEFLGELGLSGELCRVEGILPAALAASHAGRRLIIPALNAAEVSMTQDGQALIAHSLLEVCGALLGKHPWVPAPHRQLHDSPHPTNTLKQVLGQPLAKRALEIAAAGGHHLLLVGPPGSGKSLIASCLPSLLPATSEPQALEIAAIRAACGLQMDIAAWRQRPFRMPHHTASAIALVGGGSHPRPGEISLAHHGVLFLDELAEWQQHALNALREPLESGVITITRASGSMTFPARFQLIAAMNPCPCGWAGDLSGRCDCSLPAIRRYQRRISGPILDRIDLHITVTRVSPELLKPTDPTLTHVEEETRLRQRILQARSRQYARKKKLNGDLLHHELYADCTLNLEGQSLFEKAIQRYCLSARAAHKILRVARTIADLGQETQIQTQHLSEAMSYRSNFQSAMDLAPMPEP